MFGTFVFMNVIASADCAEMMERFWVFWVFDFLGFLATLSQNFWPFSNMKNALGTPRLWKRSKLLEKTLKISGQGTGGGQKSLFSHTSFKSEPQSLKFPWCRNVFSGNLTLLLLLSGFTGLGPLIVGLTTSRVTSLRNISSRKL